MSMKTSEKKAILPHNNNNDNFTIIQQQIKKNNAEFSHLHPATTKKLLNQDLPRKKEETTT